MNGILIGAYIHIVLVTLKAHIKLFVLKTLHTVNYYLSALLADIVHGRDEFPLSRLKS